MQGRTVGARRFIPDKLRAATGLSLAQYEVLARLARASEGRLRMVDIADQVCVSKSGVTQLVDRLEEAGLTARQSSPSDRRLTYAAITADGLAALERAEPVFTPAAHEHVARHLSAQEQRSLETALRKIRDANA